MAFKRYIRRYFKKGVMNKTESAYGVYLDLQKKSGLIDEWKYEPETLKIGADCRYTPDFRVIRTGFPEDPTKPCYSIIEFHEVKGTSRGKAYIEDDALVKIKAAAEMHPYKFIIVWRVKDEWKQREIN